MIEGKDRAGPGPKKIFLSYKSSDQEAVARISQVLEVHGISTFLDRKDLILGLPWPEALENALSKAEMVAVFLGPGPLGPWQKREMWFALDRQAQAESDGTRFPVIPVILPNSDPTPGFLFLNTWIDLRDESANHDELIKRFVRAVDETAPNISEKALASICPFRGLKSFREEDAAFFRGREEFSQRLLNATLSSSFVAVVGSSGSGKSSLIHAGLLPLLRRQRPPSPSWDALSFTPGERPYHRLSAALLPLLEPEMTEIHRLKEAGELGGALAEGFPMEEVLQRVLEKLQGTDRLLIIADQFEELFTLANEKLQRPFVEALLTITTKLPVTLVVSMRADFYDRALGITRAMSDRLDDALINLGPMRRDELFQAIKEPSERADLEFEPGLIDRVLDDLGEEPGNLPLLEFALVELWAGRSGHRLTHRAYSAVGGVTQAIARRAELEFAKFSPEQQHAARMVLTRLVRPASIEEGNRDTKARAKWGSFDDTGRLVVERLAGPNARLMVIGRDETGERVVEIAHDALLRSWERLRQWLDEDREFLLWRERLRTYLIDHERRGAVLVGSSLIEAQSWQVKRIEDLSAEEAGLIKISLKLQKATLARRDRRRWMLVVSAAVVVLAIVFLAMNSLQQANRAREASILVAQEFTQDPAIAALLAMEVDRLSARRIEASLESVHFAHRAALSAIPLAILRGHEDSLLKASFSPDGKRILTASADGTARVWNSNGFGTPIVIQGEPVHFEGMIRPWPVVSAAFSPDGLRILTGFDNGTVRISNVSGFGNPIVIPGSPLSLLSASFSPDGLRLLTLSYDGNVRIWNASGSGQPILLRGRANSLLSASFSPDGSRIVTASFDGARVWKADGSGEPIFLGGHEGPVERATFSPDGTRIVTASNDHTARIWNADGSGSPVVLVGHAGSVTSASFSPDGTRIVTASSDGTARVWDASGHGQPTVFLHGGPVRSAVFNPDGTRILTASNDGTAALCSLDEPRYCIALRGHEGYVIDATFSRDGTRIVTASDDGTARVWKSTGPEEPVVFSGHSDRVLRALFSPDGAHVLTLSSDGSARVWNAGGSGRAVVLPLDMKRVMLCATFTPNGQRVLFASGDGLALIWNTNGLGKPIIFQAHQGAIFSAVFSPDGSRFLTASSDGTARVWNTENPDRPVDLRGHDGTVVSAAFSRDGSHILTAATDGTARVWNLDGSGRIIVLRGHTGPLSRAVFSPDGLHILTASHDGTARVWNADGSGRAIVLRGHRGAINDANFSPDSSLILTVSSDRTARIWNVDGSGHAVVLRHEAPVYSGAFSPDGTRILTASDYGIARIWNSDGTGRPFVLPGRALDNTTFSPDGSRVLTTSRTDHSVFVWRVTWDSLLKYLRSTTYACLNAEERMLYLGEASHNARATYDSCQRARSKQFEILTKN